MDNFLDRLFRMAEIGATRAGGVCRLTLSDEDKMARGLFSDWARGLGCRVEVDQIGNQFAVKQGSDNQAPAVLIGSHLDSQPTGGKYDGALGVLAGLEVLSRLKDEGISHKNPIIIANWTNEEGARFSPAMIGSGVFAGEFSLTHAYKQNDSEGVNLKDALSRIGYLGKGGIEKNIKASFELHIEQGPVLEAEKKQIGVVTGVQGIRWYKISVTGREDHAGTAPMNLRSDPVRTMNALISDFFNMADDYQPEAKLTIGTIKTEPQSINTVPGRVTFSLDIRHPNEAVLELMHDEIIHSCTHKYKDVNLEPIWHSPHVPFHKDCINAIENAAIKLEIPYRKMVSGAGHDSVYVSRIAPAGMIFIPCRNGISHNEAEYASPEDIEAGLSVLYEAVKSMIK